MSEPSAARRRRYPGDRQRGRVRHEVVVRFVIELGVLLSSGLVGTVATATPGPICGCSRQGASQRAPPSSTTATASISTRRSGWASRRTSSRRAQALRDAVIPVVSRLRPFRRAFVRALSELDTAYAGSPIVVGSGRRYFDESMRGGKGIGRGFLVMIGDEEPSSTRETAMQLCDALGDLVELRSSPSSGVALIRPDGYVAYERHGRMTPRHWRALRRVLDRQRG